MTDLPSDDPRCHAVLRRACEASGGLRAWGALRALRMTGTIEMGGLRGPYEQRVSLIDGRYLTRYTVGPLAVRHGFDGAVSWQCGAGGEVTRQDADAPRRAARTQAWLDSRAYWFPERGAGRLEWLGERDAHTVLRATPSDGTPVELWFDDATGLLARTLTSVLGRDTVRRFEDWREVEGVRLPSRVVTSAGDDARRDILVALDTLAVEPYVPDATYEVPPPPAIDFAFLKPAGTPVPFDLVDNHVYLAASVNGHALRLLLDTGGVLLLTPEAAARAGIVAQGAIEARGPGSQAVSAALAPVPRIEVAGAVAIDRLLARVLPMPGFDAVEGCAFDGAIGLEIFRRLAVRLDYTARRVAFLAPNAQAPEAATTLALRFQAHIPLVEATLDGRRGQFWVDTGNRNAVTLWSTFVEAHRLGQDAGAETTIGWGVGGAATGRFARGGRLDLGGLVVERPLLSLKSAGGVNAMQDVAGNLGGELLRRFVVTFDYAAAAMHLEPAAAPPAPFAADRAGLWVNRHGQDAFVLATVDAGGPAEAARLRAGDIVETVDDRPAATLDLATLRAWLRDPLREAISLEVRREGDRYHATIALRDLVPR
jgi:hypothetical protein